METNAYDGNGNPTTYSSGSASYDEENRLTAFPAGAQVWGAGYRADGLRAWTRKTATGAKTYYYYDQGNAVLETKADGTMVGMNIFAPDGLVTRWSKLSGTIPVVGDYQFDWQGNAVHCLFSGARYADEPLIHSAYNAWGQRNFVYSNGAGSVSDLLRFGYNARWGYKLDTETGLYYCQQRNYDPANGRWVTRDPIGLDGGVNVYGYCGDRVTLSEDAEGLTAKLCDIDVGIDHWADRFWKNRYHTYFESSECSDMIGDPVITFNPDKGVVIMPKPSIPSKGASVSCTTLNIDRDTERCICGHLKGLIYDNGAVSRLPGIPIPGAGRKPPAGGSFDGQPWVPGRGKNCNDFGAAISDVSDKCEKWLQQINKSGRDRFGRNWDK